MNTYIFIIIVFLIIGIIALVANAIEDHNSVASFSKSMELNNMPIIALKHDNMDIYFLVDSGSDISYIDESLLDKLTIKEKTGEGYDVLTANGYMKTNGSILIELAHDGKTIDGEFTIGNIKDAMDCAFAPHWKVRGIIGSIILKKYKYVIDYNKNEIRCKRKRGTKISTTK